MYRLVFASLVWLAPAVATAQSTGNCPSEAILPAPGDATPVEITSPYFTQARLAAIAHFWRLDAGHYVAELWYSSMFNRDKSTDGLLQADIEMGVAQHVQFGLTQNFSFDGGGWVGPEGTQVALRYAFGDHYGAIPTNPTLYLGWHPRHEAPDHFELRMLLGGDGLAARLAWVVNVYAEAHLDTAGNPDLAGNSSLGWSNTDISYGASGALSYTVLRGSVRLGVEGQLGADQRGNPGGSAKFSPVYLIGPNALLTVPEHKLYASLTLLLGLGGQDPKAYPFAIFAKRF